ncbi:MAG: histidine phosphatase family protein, partial [Pseudomonadota bacterium]
THAEVTIDPDVPVPDWGLNPVGQARHAAFAERSEVGGVTSIYCSTERKAVDGAAPVAGRLSLEPRHRKDLGENDRSATGYLPPAIFWPVVDRFFAEPTKSVLGWERAIDAHTRITRAVTRAADEAPEGDVLVVSHGGVATLLRCQLKDVPITKKEGAPHPGGGCWFVFARTMDGPPSEWNVI